jgi:hypothetical protein
MDAKDRLDVAMHDNTPFRLMYAVGSDTNFRGGVVDEVPGLAVGYCCRLALNREGRPYIVSVTNTFEHEPAKVRLAWHAGAQWHVEGVIPKANRASTLAVAL